MENEMALDPVKFHTNSGGGRQIHSYNGGADASAAVIGGAASGYFNAITDRLHQGDVIHCSLAGNTVLQDALVTSVTGAAVVTTALAT
jgi:hypothetical protein